MTKLFTKLISLFLVATVLHTFIYYFTSAKSKPEILTTLQALISKKSPVLFLGDSVLYTFSKTESHQETVPELLQAELPNISVATFARKANHLELFEVALDYMHSKGYEPHSLLVPINLRSFSPEWDPRPEYQFNLERAQIEFDSLKLSSLLKPALILKVVDMNPVSLAQYRQLSVFEGSQKVGLVKDFLLKEAPTSKKELRDSFVFRYLYPLSQEHRKLKSLENILRQAKTRNIHAIVYVTPIDAETGIEVTGNHFDKIVQANVSCIQSVIEKSGHSLLDFSRRFGKEAFIWREEGAPNEHLNHAGRQALAKSLSSEIGYTSNLFPRDISNEH